MEGEHVIASPAWKSRPVFVTSTFIKAVTGVQALSDGRLLSWSEDVPSAIGTPQGGVISPLLANIVLNRLDWELHAAGYYFVRYADDFVVLCQPKRQTHEALAFVERVLTDALGLQLSAEKTKVTKHAA